MNEEGKASEGEDQAPHPMRIGLVATNPLRVLGLQQMFAPSEEDGTQSAEIVPLSVPGIMQDATLSNVLIDASCTEHLFELLRTFRRIRPQVRLIVIGDSVEPSYIQQVIGAGARGYVTQTTSQNELRMALAMVNDGSVWAPRRVLARLLDASSHFAGEAKPEISFTPRELEVLGLLKDGLPNHEIARELKIGASTVKAHMSRLMRKVGVSNRVELTLYALRRQSV